MFGPAPSRSCVFVWEIQRLPHHLLFGTPSLLFLGNVVDTARISVSECTFKSVYVRNVSVF